MAQHLQVQSISKRFGATDVLRDVSLDIRPGEFVTLLGPSGCGKTTLLRIIAGLESADAGTIAMAGAALDQLAPKDRGVAFVFQSYALYPHLTAHQNIAAPLVMRELTALQRLPLLGRLVPGTAAARRSIDERVHRTAAMLQLEALLQRRPAELSGGQRQRVALGRALVRAPRLFLMDEPLANLDASLRIQMRGEIARLHRALGATTIFVTHDQAEAAALSDRVAVMFGGRISQFASPLALYRDPASLEVARFLTQPCLNVLDAPAPLAGIVTIGEHRLAVRDAEGVTEPGTLAFRPEHARLVKAQGSGLPVTVARIEHSGTDAHVFLDMPAASGPFVIRLDSENAARLEPGSAQLLAIDAERAWFFPRSGPRGAFLRSRAA